MNLDIRPISSSLSAEIRGVNLSHDLTEGTVAAIRQTFLDHIVIFFRGRTCHRNNSWRSRTVSAARWNIPS